MIGNRRTKPTVNFTISAAGDTKKGEFTHAKVCHIGIFRHKYIITDNTESQIKIWSQKGKCHSMLQHALPLPVYSCGDAEGRLWGVSLHHTRIVAIQVWDYTSLATEIRDLPALEKFRSERGLFPLKR